MEIGIAIMDTFGSKVQDRNFENIQSMNCILGNSIEIHALSIRIATAHFHEGVYNKVKRCVRDHISRLLLFFFLSLSVSLSLARSALAIAVITGLR